MNVEEHFTAINQALADLDAEVSSLKDQRERLKTEINDIQSDKQQSQVELEKVTLATREESKQLLIQLDRLKDEVSGLEHTKEELLQKKSDLQKVNASLEHANKEFIKYETSAKKILKNFEDSLVQREKVVKEREGLRFSKRSILN